MADLVNNLANLLSDAAILAVSAITFAFLGGGIALATNRLWFRRWNQRSAFEDKLADTAHTSLLGLSAFVLALLITNGVSSLAKTDEVVRQEGVAIYRLDRELGALGPAAHDARQTLVAYAKNVADDEWPRLAALPNALSPLVQKNLDDLWGQVRALQRGMDPSNPARGDLGTDLRLIETLRTSRLAAATISIPKIFWVILLLLVAAASFLSGREAPKRFGLQVNLIHMAAIGLAVGLVIVLNNPFRGQTSVDPAIIRSADFRLHPLPGGGEGIRTAMQLAMHSRALAANEGSAPASASQFDPVVSNLGRLRGRQRQPCKHRDIARGSGQPEHAKKIRMKRGGNQYPH